MACVQLTAFQTATEHLDQRLLKAPGSAKRNLWRNMIPKGTYPKGVGVTGTTFEMKPSNPVDNPDSWTTITLDDTTEQPTPGCDTNYEDVSVGFFKRTYSPQKVRLRGPVICREDLVFQHMANAFLNGYEEEMGRYAARKLEFKLRSDFTYFSNWYSDYVRFDGPNARPTVTVPASDIMMDQLDDVASDLIDRGIGPDSTGYVMEGQEGPIYPVQMDKRAIARLLKNNTERRDDARWASAGKGADSNVSLWTPIGATRTIGNFRLIPTEVPLRFNNVGGVLTPVTPYKSIDAYGQNGDQFTDAYRAARYEAAIVMNPQVFTMEVVTPDNWKFHDTTNYMGEWNFITGGERICDPARYDPQHELGRHFTKFEYAPRPDRPYAGAVLVYKRCPTDQATSTCSTYT